MGTAMDSEPSYDDLFQQALAVGTKRGIRRGILFLIVGMVLGVACYQMIEGPAPTLTEDNMFDLGNPNMRYKYGMWASGLIAYTGAVMIYGARNLQKNFNSDRAQP